LGLFPTKLKFSKIIPIYKADSPFDPANHRPISLLPIIGKLFEKIMHKRLYSFILSKNILIKSNMNSKETNLLSML